MSFTIDESYVLSFLKKLLDTPSPSGYTHDIIEMIRKEAESLHVDFELNNKGELCSHCLGRTLPERSD